MLISSNWEMVEEELTWDSSLLSLVLLGTGVGRMGPWPDVR